jgi:ferredoxin-like protein FixX
VYHIIGGQGQVSIFVNLCPAMVISLSGNGHLSVRQWSSLCPAMVVSLSGNGRLSVRHLSPPNVRRRVVFSVFSAFYFVLTLDF